MSAEFRKGMRVVTLEPSSALTHDGRLYWPAGTEGVVESVTDDEVRVTMQGGWSNPYRLSAVAPVLPTEEPK